MASSKLMTTASTSNQNSPPHQSIYPSPLTSLLSDPPQIDTDDFFKNIYSSPPPSTIVEDDDKRMTLEDYLNKAVVATVDDNNAAQYHGTGVVVAGNGNQSQGAVVVVDGGGSGRGRGKRRVAEETPLDKASQQKQRRMIKNRESAARSRERKQAYTVELESLVMQLEEENARLQREEAEEKKRRYKQLMKDLIPITEKQIPGPPRPGVLRRVLSMRW